MKTFILLHIHKYGESIYYFECNSTKEGLEKNVYSVCEILDIDFEEEKNEYISFHELKDDELKTVIL